MLGSLQDAEDMLQETLLAAWRGLDGYQERASLRTWLYRIATNRCLNHLRGTARRPAADAPPMPEPPPPTRHAEPLWLQPYPDVLLEGLPDAAPGPAARYETKEATALAFVAGLQRLPVPQRTALVLRDVLGFSARRERRDAGHDRGVGQGRAPARTRGARRATGRRRARTGPGLAAGARGRRPLRGRASSAATRTRVVALLADDAWVTMPPYPFEYQGREAIARFLEDRARLRGGPLRAVPTRANGQPAFGCYLDARP